MYYTVYDMKNITITITEELDAAARAEARRRGVSKSELIRETLSAALTEVPVKSKKDLWYELAGFGEPGISVEPEEIDDIIYR
jgi:hypothetical protein